MLEDRIRKNEVQGAALRGTMLHRLLQVGSTSRGLACMPQV